MEWFSCLLFLLIVCWWTYCQTVSGEKRGEAVRSKLLLPVRNLLSVKVKIYCCYKSNLPELSCFLYFIPAYLCYFWRNQGFFFFLWGRSHPCHLSLQVPSVQKSWACLVYNESVLVVAMFSSVLCCLLSSSVSRVFECSYLWSWTVNSEMIASAGRVTLPFQNKEQTRNTSRVNIKPVVWRI